MLCCAMRSSTRGVLFPHGGICSKYLEAHESLWRELSVAMLLVSQAVRPCLGIRHAIKRWETIAVALAERPRSRVNMIAVSLYVNAYGALSAKTADRPEFQCMIKDSAKEPFEIVLVWKLDRFSCDRYDSAHYKHILKKNGVKVVSAKEHISEGPEGICLVFLLA